MANLHPAHLEDVRRSGLTPENIQAPPHLDPKAIIGQTLAFLHPDGEAFELCIIGPKQNKSGLWEGYAGGKKPIVAGWFRNPGKAAALAAQVQATGLYVTLNPCQEALLARVNERLVAGVSRTQDKEIARIMNLLVDLDPIRPEGISSSDLEHEATLEMAQVIRSDLEKEGWPAPLVGDSGNGAHLIYPLDLPRDDDTTALLKDVLTGLAHRYSDHLARLNLEVDQAVFNPARLTKLYGTMVRKGDHTPDRPHRLARIISLPEARQPMPVELLERIARTADFQESPRTKAPEQARGNFDLEGYLNRYGVEVVQVKNHGGAVLYCLERCVFDPSHSGNEAAIGQASDGTLFYQCFHNSCQGRTWAEARQIISGDANLREFIRGQGGATGGAWPEPEPLRRTPEPGEPFPVEALGGVLAPAARAMHENIKAPAAICGQAVLATANLAVQGFSNVEIDGRRFPLSEFFLSVAVSGDRKSAADRAALTPVDAHEKELMEAYRKDFSKYENELLLWKKARDEALKKTKGRREVLEALPPQPNAPHYPQLTTEEPTYEGLTKLLAHGRPSVGLFSDEAGRFFGGYAMSADHRLKTLAGLSALWDGRSITRTRGGDGAITLYGRRVCAHLLMQPLVAETILSDPLAHDQGFLSRCLIVAPESALGAQTYVAQDLSIEASYGRYCARLTAILQAKLPLKVDPETGNPTNELTPRALPVSPDGKEIWIRFHDWVQDHLKARGIFRPISGIAAKAGEHALRLAGTMALVKNIDATFIPPEHVKAGIVLARFYLTEALRLFHAAKTNPDILLAEKVLAWLKAREGSSPQVISLPCVYQTGPNAVRDKATAARCMAILGDHGWVRPVEGGAEIDGKKRRQVWEVNPDV